MANMHLSRLFSFCLLFTLLSFNQSVLSQTRYVSDQLSINMRSDKGTQFKIIRILKSGTQLQILVKDNSGYTKVKTPKGHIGWVLTRFLQDNNVARNLLEENNKSVNSLKNINIELKSKVDQLTSENLELLEIKKKLSQEKIDNNNEIHRLKKIAARPMQLERNNEKLRQEILSSEADTRLLKQELQTFREANDKEWFISGALVLFGGILLGLILPKMKSRQRAQSWSRLS